MAGSKLVFANRKIVTEFEENFGGRELVLLRFITVYEELRKACPRGELNIHVFVEADSAEEVGVVYEGEEPKR